MKQLLFLFLFPCLAVAQYQGNANQKITLGEQTTADGLVFRGVAADTTLTVKSDTAAYFVLDTVNLNLYTYKASASGRKWRQLGADTAAIAYVNTYGTQTVNGAKTFTSELTATRFNPTGTSATGNGMYLPETNTLGFSTNGTEKVRITSGGNVGIGTTVPSYANLVISNASVNSGNNSAIANGRITALPSNASNYGNIYLFSTDSYAADKGGTISFGSQYGNIGGDTRMSAIFGGKENSLNLDFSGYLSFYTRLSGNQPTERMRITSGGNVGIGTTSPQSGYRLHVVDSVYVGGNVSASAYTTRSDYDLKDEIQNISYGINEVMQMQPVKYTYKSNGSTQLGFIAQDLGVITPEVVSFEDKMSVYYNALIPILTKAIQEQQALIKALEQRIINLENK